MVLFKVCNNWIINWVIKCPMDIIKYGQLMSHKPAKGNHFVLLGKEAL